jgi:hypothetical protein
MSLENAYKIICEVERTHPNLGLPVVWCKLIDIANMGTFVVAERGRGKGSIMSAVEQLKHRDLIKINMLTYKGLKKLEEQLDNRENSIINRDLSTLYTDYLKDVGLNVISNLITDHQVRAETGQYSLDIKDAYISYIGGVQPQLLSKLCKLGSWESLYKDRFIRYYIFYLKPLSKPSTLEPKVPQIEFYKASSVPKEVKDDKIYKTILKTIADQTSENRSTLYLDALLKASASLNCRASATSQDLKLLYAMLLNLRVDVMLGRREYSVAEPIVFDSGAYIVLFETIQHKEVSRRNLSEQYQVSQKTISKDMDLLQGRGIIKGTFGADKYTISPKFYSMFVAPQEEIRKEAGLNE